MKEILRKCVGTVLLWLESLLCIILFNVVVPIIVGVGWLITIPVKIIVMVCHKQNSICISIEDLERILCDVRDDWEIHYSLSYLLMKVKLNIANKIGWAL